MQDPVELSCVISSTDFSAAVGLEIWLDHNQIFNTEHVSETVNFVYQFDDAEQQHQLRFVLKNKVEEHTEVAPDGTIVQDCCVSVSKLSFDGIEIDQIVNQRAVYQHNFNGHADMIQDKFFGLMGCNGTVCLNFETPVYLWLLEVM